MNEKDLGFTADQVIQVRINNERMIENAQSFSNRLLADRNIITASYASGHPGGFYDASTVRVEGAEENLRMRTLYADENFLETLDIQLAAGRFFSKEFPGDSTGSAILNETAVKQLGWSPEEAIGKRVMLSQFDRVYNEIVGVVDDYHFTSLKDVIEPLIISYSQESRNLFVKVSGANVGEAVAGIEQIWNAYQSGFPIETRFLDEVLGKLYADEINQGKMFRIFSAISVLIACFGILGLSTYIAVQRKKEIGVRKVLGASTSHLSFLLTKDLLQLVLLANILAIPVAYLVLDRWSQSFAYRAPFDPLLFLLAGALVTAIAIVIVSLNAVRAAGEDPVKSLRPE
jgi:putative ABC transport system permease protein